jgi:tRNA (cytidine/uridine-2'-O-)-methyltransferase
VIGAATAASNALPAHNHPAAMAVELALYQPDIAQNTGTLLRLGACVGTRIHIIHPTGFALTRQTLRRSGLDYLDHADFTEHVSFAAFDTFRRAHGRRLVLLTTKAESPVYAAEFKADDILLVGRESAGVPQAVADSTDLRLRIPMRQSMRSLNVAIAAALVLGEAKRQTGEWSALE